MNGGRPREGDVPGVRRLTVRESARLQSFPDGHAFVGSQSSRYRQVGNAVPPLLAEALAKSLMKQLSGEKEMSPDTSAAWQSTLPLSF
jgi:DNA (cytosine-5)-methyltransferase 1